ncbi:MAG: hypothetical protein WCP86_10905 [bacterium]
MATIQTVLPLLELALSDAKKLEDYSHIQTVKKQDNLFHHSFDDVMKKLNIVVLTEKNTL